MIRPRDVAPGVAVFPARTPTLPPATHTNSYALTGRDGVLLIEPATPYEDERAAWLEWARAVARPIVGVLLTHHHVDHASAAAHFSQALDAPLIAHRATFARLSGLASLEQREVGDGDRLELGGRAWDVLHTPGHAPGHICLHDRAGRTLIAGDMVANGSTILIPPDDGGDMAEYMAQLRRLDALDTTLVLPAHGEPIDDPRALFSYYLQHRLMREEKVLAAFRARRDELRREPSAEELVSAAYDDTPPFLWPIARGAVEAHLIKLRADGRL